MIESLVINKVLRDKSLKPLRDNGLTLEHFLTEKDKVQFIEDHVRDYGIVPDTITFLEKFPDFEVTEVSESDAYLAYRLKEAVLYKDIVPVIKTVADMVREEDSVKALQYLKGEIEKLARSNNIQTGRGYDLISNAADRLKEYKLRTETHGLLGITTGITLLDELLHGWVKEDLVVIFARTNMGKSWILLYFLMVAWAHGFKVLLYSGEMSADLVGFRFDTLYKNFSNLGLMNGSENLGDANSEVGERDMDDYERYITELSEKTGFIVVTPKDFGSVKPTVSDLKRLVELHQVDILGVDQISLMRDERAQKEQQPRTAFTHIAEDLFHLSEDMRIPVIAAAQANRDAVKGKDKDVAPELHEIGESDGIAQNATRCISMNVLDSVLKLAIKKNRYGINNKDVLLHWNINLGLLKPLLEGGAQQAQEGFGF